MYCALNTLSGKELLTNSIKEKLSILESEREKLRSLTSDVSNYEVTVEEKEWLLSFLLDKDFHLVNKELALRAIDNSPLSRFRKNLMSLQDVCDYLLKGVTRSIGSALDQNCKGCVLLKGYLKELEFIDVITQVPKEVLQVLRDEPELLSTPIDYCLKDLVEFAGDGIVCRLFAYKILGVDLVEVGDSLLIKGYDFNVVKDFIDRDCKNSKSNNTNVDSDTDNVSSTNVLAGTFISLLIIFFVLKVSSFI